MCIVASIFGSLLAQLSATRSAEQVNDGRIECFLRQLERILGKLHIGMAFAIEWRTPRRGLTST